MTDELGHRPKHWVRTIDHPVANQRTPEIGERQWNLDFEDEDGDLRRVYVGELTRTEFLKQLEESNAKYFTEEDEV